MYDTSQKYPASTFDVVSLRRPCVSDYNRTGCCCQQKVGMYDPTTGSAAGLARTVYLQRTYMTVYLVIFPAKNTLV
jgi:hypothetical protein